MNLKKYIKLRENTNKEVILTEKEKTLKEQLLQRCEEEAKKRKTAKKEE